MSLNTLARQAMEKRAAAVAVRESAQAAAGNSVPTQEDALSSIAKYIPTEVITLFLFGVSVLPKPEANYPPWVNAKTLALALLIFTPACFYLIFTAKFRAENQGNWPEVNDLPVFRLIAATVGFAVWAAAVPNSGLLDAKYTVIAAFAALAVSTLFSLLEQAFEPKIATKAV